MGEQKNFTIDGHAKHVRTGDVARVCRVDHEAGIVWIEGRGPRGVPIAEWDPIASTETSAD